MKDRINNGEFKVQYCPTLLTIGDFFTKPLVEKRFREFRKVIMGEKSNFDLEKSIFEARERNLAASEY